MDGDRFDEMAKALAARAPTRRAMLRALLAAVPAAGLARFGADQATATRSCTRVGRRCRRDKECCSRRCRHHRCACKRRQTRCGGRCVDLLRDKRHCGACGHRCPGGTDECRHGMCCSETTQATAQTIICQCSPAGFACDRETVCCPIGSCLPSGVCG